MSILYRGWRRKKICYQWVLYLEPIEQKSDWLIIWPAGLVITHAYTQQTTNKIACNTGQKVQYWPTEFSYPHHDITRLPSSLITCTSQFSFLPLHTPVSTLRPPSLHQSNCIVLSTPARTQQSSGRATSLHRDRWTHETPVGRQQDGTAQWWRVLDIWRFFPCHYLEQGPILSQFQPNTSTVLRGYIHILLLTDDFHEQ